MIAMTRTLRIAVADDEPVVRDYFRRMLPRLGHEVVATAANGRELVELCREQKPDLIIADVRMPDMDGDDAIQEICSVRPTPFILLSAYSKPASMPDGLELVDCAYLTKPVKREDLEQAIERVCPPVPE
jgi:YesN/AraC family two-component response regulator